MLINFKSTLFFSRQREVLMAPPLDIPERIEDCKEARNQLVTSESTSWPWCKGSGHISCSSKSWPCASTGWSMIVHWPGVAHQFRRRDLGDHPALLSSDPLLAVLIFMSCHGKMWKIKSYWYEVCMVIVKKKIWGQKVQEIIRQRAVSTLVLLGQDIWGHKVQERRIIGR